MTTGQIRVGIGGWTYAPWRGVFYPDKLPHSKELEFASRNSARSRSTPPSMDGRSRKAWETWAKTVRRTASSSRSRDRAFVSRGPRLCGRREGLDQFFAQGFAALGPKLGPMLWQFAPRRKFDRETSPGSSTCCPTSRRHSSSSRHRSPGTRPSATSAFFQLCAATATSQSSSRDSDDFPLIEAETADFAYARLQRMNEAVRPDMIAGPRRPRRARAAVARAAGKDCYLFLINGAKVRAPAAALALQERLG